MGWLDPEAGMRTHMPVTLEAVLMLGMERRSTEHLDSKDDSTCS